MPREERLPWMMERRPVPSSTLCPGVEHISEPVPDEVEGESPQKHHEPGEGRRPPLAGRYACLTVGHEHTPLGEPGLGQPYEAEGGRSEDDPTHVHGGL